MRNVTEQYLCVLTFGRGTFDVGKMLLGSSENLF